MYNSETHNDLDLSINQYYSSRLTGALYSSVAFIVHLLSRVDILSWKKSNKTNENICVCKNGVVVIWI